MTMDELINQYADVLQNAKVGDYTYIGILSEFAHAVIKVHSEPDEKEPNDYPTDKSWLV